MLPVIYDHLSQRSSSKVVYHFAQMMKAGGIFYGNGEKLVAPEDVKTLAETLPSTEAIYQIDYEGWNHNDFVYAIHAKNLVYDIIIQHMEEKEKEAIIADHDGSYSYNYE